MAYDAQDHNRALDTYRDSGRNMEQTSRLTDISKPTLYKWKKAGRPTDRTGGQSWDDYLDQEEELRIQRAKREESLQKMDFVEEQQERLKEMLDTMHRQIVEGDVQIRPGDYDKVLRLYFMLDSRERDLYEKMQEFAAWLIGIVAEEVSEQQLAKIKSKALSKLQSKKDQMDFVQLPGS